MSYHLLKEAFFPVVTEKGRRITISFPQIADNGDDPVVDFAWPRADFNIASYEFCIGVLAAVFQPDAEIWRNLWCQTLATSELEKFLQPVVPAFNLDGDGPCFMQEFGGIEENNTSAIEGLLIDTPGINGQKKNADLLTHRDRFDAFGFAAAAMALYTLQQFAPSGGAGNRTSMRGGGPMTVLAFPGRRRGKQPDLWQKLLANLPLVKEPLDLYEADNLARVFPWLKPTLVSDKASGERIVHDNAPEVHPLQAFFGMPRRIRLHIVSEPGICALTGTQGPIVSGFSQKPWGMNYGNWQHPLTPYRRQKEDGEPYSVKPKTGRFGYRDWVGIRFTGHDDKLHLAPENLKRAEGERNRILRGDAGSGRMLVGGWAMSNMEAISFLYSHQPLHLPKDDRAALAIAELAMKLVAAADETNYLLRSAIREANFSSGASAPAADSALFSSARTRFFERTELGFHSLLNEAVGEDDFDKRVFLDRWHLQLRRAAIAVFDEFAPDPAIHPEQAERSANGNKTLLWGLNGYGAVGKKLFEALDKPVPKKGKAKTSKEKA